MPASLSAYLFFFSSFTRAYAGVCGTAYTCAYVRSYSEHAAECSVLSRVKYRDVRDARA